MRAIYILHFSCYFNIENFTWNRNLNVKQKKYSWIKSVLNIFNCLICSHIKLNWQIKVFNELDLNWLISLKLLNCQNRVEYFLVTKFVLCLWYITIVDNINDWQCEDFVYFSSQCVYVSQLNDLFFLYLTHGNWIIQSQRF